MPHAKIPSNVEPLAGRSIIIGDVHGCADELEQLLESVSSTEQDSVYFVGDLVARGPKSTRVLALFRELGAAGVLGNHEARLLEARAARREGRAGPRLGPAHERLMTELGSADWELLEQLPLTLDLPGHGICIVHAGVVPGVPLTRQRRPSTLVSTPGGAG